jgi:molybdopterin molybdotransferase
VFLLPGNPVSCLCAYEFFAGPTLRALGGRARAWPHRRVALPLARKISSAIGRTDYVRVAIERAASCRSRRRARRSCLRRCAPTAA